MRWQQCHQLLCFIDLALNWLDWEQNDLTSQLTKGINDFTKNLIVSIILVLFKQIIRSIRYHRIVGSSDQLQRKVFWRDKVVGEDDVDVELEAEAEDVGVGARADEVPRKNHEDRDFKIPGDVAVTDLEY